MAKYDTYTLTAQIGKPEQSAILSISILFEDGDDISTVIQQARDRIKTEAIAMKNTNFTVSLKQ